MSDWNFEVSDEELYDANENQLAPGALAGSGHISLFGRLVRDCRRLRLTIAEGNVPPRPDHSCSLGVTDCDGACMDYANWLHDSLGTKEEDGEDFWKHVTDNGRP